MKNSKLTSMFVLAIMFLYFLFSQIYLVKLGNIYYYVINPLFFVIMAFWLKIKMLSPYKSEKYKKPLLQFVVITALIYTVIYIISGLFLKYGKNPYSSGIVALLLNLYSTMLVILCREYIRFKIINNVFKKDRKIICILVVITFVMQDIPIVSLVNDFNVYSLFKNLFSVVIPSVSINSLLTYIELYTDYWAGFIYELIMNLVLWIPPILPKAPWIFSAIMDTIFPLLLLIYCMNYITSRERVYFKSVKMVGLKQLIPISAGLVLIIWFAIGIFPIKPIGIASGSMYPEFSIGDALIIKKCSANDVDVGDIIEYKNDGNSIVHRIIEKHRKNGKIVFITKGDNNELPDKDPVDEDQVQGKVIGKIPYIAWPMLIVKKVVKIE